MLELVDEFSLVEWGFEGWISSKWFRRSCPAACLSPCAKASTIGWCNSATASKWSIIRTKLIRVLRAILDEISGDNNEEKTGSNFTGSTDGAGHAVAGKSGATGPASQEWYDSRIHARNYTTCIYHHLTCNVCSEARSLGEKGSSSNPSDWNDLGSSVG